MKNKGFTLIELLVVIAIIGILSSVVLVSLNSARGKAQAVALKSSLRSLQAAVAMCDDANLVASTTPGGNVCAGSAALYPTATQLNVTSYTIAVSGSASANMLTISLTGHPVSGCNALSGGTPAVYLDAASTTFPVNCK